MTDYPEDVMKAALEEITQEHEIYAINYRSGRLSRSIEAHEVVQALCRAITAERERLSSLVERLRMEAEAHAQESRTMRAIVHEIYQHVTGATGEPADWNGARPVIEEIDRLRERAKPKVKPLVWEGLRSGPYFIEIHEGGIADLYNNADRDEDGELDSMCGGYLTLVSLDDLKAAAQADHERRVLSALEGHDDG